MTGTTHDIVNPATTVSLVVKVSGITPATPSGRSANAPTISPPAASVIEFSPSAVGGDFVGHHEVARRADGGRQSPHARRRPC